jgi:hypothetical protein
MNQSLSDRFKSRLVLAILLSGAGLMVGHFWGGEGTPSWAAPGQNPYLQTVPTRRPTRTPTPSEPTPPSAPTEQPTGDDQGDDGDDAPPATPPVEQNTPTPSPAETSKPASPSATSTEAAFAETPGSREPGTATQPSQNLATPASSDHFPETVTGGDDVAGEGHSVPPLPLLTPSPPLEPTSTDGIAQPLPSQMTASPPGDRSDQISETGLPSPYWLGPLYWLYALGLGLILILCGVFLVNRS